MEVITVVSDSVNQSFKEIFIPSCESYNLDLVVLEYPYDLQTNRIKDILLHEYLKNVSNNTIVVFTEASNTIFLTTEKELLRKFKNFQCEILFSICPLKTNAEVGPLYSPAFLSSDAFMGYAGSIKHIYSRYPFFPEHLNSDHRSNHLYWQDVYVHEYPGVKLDIKQEIFFKMPSIQTSILSNIQSALENNNSFADEINLNFNVNIKNGRIQHSKNEMWPCLVSFNS